MLSSSPSPGRPTPPFFAIPFRRFTAAFALCAALLAYCAPRAGAQAPAADGRGLLEPPFLSPPAARAADSDDATSEEDPLARPFLSLPTEMGPVIVMQPSQFERTRGTTLEQGAGYLQSTLVFTAADGRARVRFAAPANADYAIAAVHDGLGPMEVTVQGRVIRLPGIPSVEEGGRGVTLLTTAFFAGRENEIELRATGGGGRLRALFVSAPLARLRKMTLQHARLLASMHLLERNLERDAAQTRSTVGGEAKYRALLEGRDTLRNELRPALETRWVNACSNLWRRYDAIHQGPTALEIAGFGTTLQADLDAAAEVFEALRSKLAPDALTDPTDLRLPAGAVSSDAFAAYPWFVLRKAFINPADDAIGRLHALGLDAAAVDPAAWPPPTMLDLMAKEQAWCILRAPEPLRRSLHSLSEQAPDIITRNALESRIAPYATRTGALGLVYWPTPEAPSPLPAVDGPPESVPRKLARLQTATTGLRDHFRRFNQYASEIAPSIARIGLFTSPELKPWGFEEEAGVSGQSLLLDTGFPAVGVPTRASPTQLGYVAGLARYDPARRPWWEASYLLRSPREDHPAEALERDLWRLLFWRITGVEFDAGRNGEDLFVEGAAPAGLVDPAWLRLAAVKADLMRLGKTIRNSRLETGGAALLEPGLPMPEGRTRPVATRWGDWFVDKRLPPLWIPHEELVAPGEAAGLFDDFRLLIAPGPLVMSRERGAALMEWVRGGGVLVTVNPLGYITPEGRIAMAFRSALGVERAEGEPGRWRLGSAARLAEGAEVLHRDASGRPDMVIAGVGKGHLLVGLDGVDEGAMWFRLVDRTCAFVLENPLVRCEAPADAVEVVARRDERGRLLVCAVNLRTDRAMTVDLDVAGSWRSAVDLTYEAPLPVTAGARRSSVRLTLEPARGRCVRLEGGGGETPGLKADSSR